MSLIRNVNVAFQDGGALDAFGRLRVSNPTTLFDSKQTYDDPDLASNVENSPLFYDNQQISGSGTSTLFEINKAQTVLGVSNLTAGKRVRQTLRRFNYQPGKSLLIIMSFIFGTKSAGITRYEGYGDDNNGLFLKDSGTDYYFVRRTYSSGSVVDTGANAVVRGEWNLDHMDGTGKSGVNLDFTKTQLLVIDLEWLGVGRVRMGFNVDGVTHYAHQFLNANVLDVVYMSTPNLPLRSEISNSGAGPAATLTQICSTVISEGGLNPNGVVRHESTAGTAVTCTTENTLYAVIGFRLKQAYLGCTIEILDAVLQVQSASKLVEWELVWNPTVAGTFTYVDVTRSAIQKAIGATANTVTGGICIAGGYAESGNAAAGKAGSTRASVEDAMHLGSTIAGVSDTLVLCCRPIGGTSGVDVEGSLTWHELL